MAEDTFIIVFQKLSEAGVNPEVSGPSEATRAEIDEIDELRRLALEISGPEPMSYTTS